MEPTRRRVLAACGALAVFSSLPRARAVVPKSGRLDFEALRDGAPFGWHRLRFRREGDLLHVEIAIDFEVSFAFLAFYRYRHRNHEVGEILIVSSVAGYRGLPTLAYYGASKAALINLAESLKFDLDQHGVRMRLIDPGFVKTPLTDKNEFPMPFLFEAEEAARRISRGLGRTSFEITFPKRFTMILKVLRCLPYRLYFPLVARATRK